jgi:hypothetical protein
MGFYESRLGEIWRAFFIAKLYHLRQSTVFCTKSKNTGQAIGKALLNEEPYILSISHTIPLKIHVPSA